MLFSVGTFTCFVVVVVVVELVKRFEPERVCIIVVIILSRSEDPEPGIEVAVV